MTSCCYWNFSLHRTYKKGDKQVGHQQRVQSNMNHHRVRNFLSCYTERLKKEINKKATVLDQDWCKVAIKTHKENAKKVEKELCGGRNNHSVAEKRAE